MRAKQLMLDLALTVLYLGLITPLALIARICGRDALSLKPQATKSSHWKRIGPASLDTDEVSD